MKIGILTFHRADNYGAVLQCYALQEVLKDMGHEVKIIDYAQPVIDRSYTIQQGPSAFELLNPARLRKYLFPPNRFFKERAHRRQLTMRKPHFKTFRETYLNLTEECDSRHIPADFDCYVIGSDQLFSLNITETLDPVYSGNFPIKKGARRIGYAISLNKQSVSEIGASGWKEILKRFYRFSLREPNLATWVKDLTGCPIATCIDPTLLTSSRMWERITHNTTVKPDSIVVYEARQAKGKHNCLRSKAQLLARKQQAHVVDLSRLDCSIEEWVGHIQQARCVVTSSFHAVAFALIFKRPLYAFCLHDGQDARYSDLLRATGMENSLHDLAYTPELIPQVDGKLIEERLSQLRKPSLNYLSEAISNGE